MCRCAKKTTDIFDFQLLINKKKVNLAFIHHSIFNACRGILCTEYSIVHFSIASSTKSLSPPTQTAYGIMSSSTGCEYLGVLNWMRAKNNGTSIE